MVAAGVSSVDQHRAQEGREQPRVARRWLIAAAAVMMQIALGAVHAWSVFSGPLIAAGGWTSTQVAIPYTITSLTLGFAFFGGLLMNRIGPRAVGLIAGALYGLGVGLASLSAGQFWVLVLTYGLIGGIGVGLGYIVPVATLVKWFPDRRGFITGLAVAGYGAGALVVAPVAVRLIAAFGVWQTFAALGVAYFVMVTGAALFMRNPPEGYRPAGWNPVAAGGTAQTTRDYTLGEALRTWQWYALWLLFFLSGTAGKGLIAEASPLAQESTGATALAAASLVGIISIANGVGRFVWAWLSDSFGRKTVFLLMFLAQAVVFATLPLTHNFVFFTILISLVLLCFGGAVGTIPAFTADYFGARNIGTIYGLMLTANGLGGVLGPLLIAGLHERTGTYTQALNVIAVLMMASVVIPYFVRSPQEGGATLPVNVLASLPNRDLVLDRLGHALGNLTQHPGAVGVLWVTLDDFQEVNDRLGTRAANQLLVAAAERLQASVRTGDRVEHVDGTIFAARLGDTVAHLGGPNFTVLLQGITDSGDAIVAAERIGTVLRAPVRIGDARAGASIGIAVGSAGDESPEGLLDAAGAAMQEAQQAGRDRYALFDSARTVAPPGLSPRLPAAGDGESRARAVAATMEHEAGGDRAAAEHVDQEWRAEDDSRPESEGADTRRERVTTEV